MQIVIQWDQLLFYLSPDELPSQTRSLNVINSVMLVIKLNFQLYTAHVIIILAMEFCIFKFNQTRVDFKFILPRIDFLGCRLQKLVALFSRTILWFSAELLKVHSNSKFCKKIAEIQSVSCRWVYWHAQMNHGFFNFRTAVFCNLQLINQPFLHNNFRYSMGACLSTQSKYQQILPNATPIQPNPLRAQIAKQFKQPSIPSPSNNQPLKPNTQLPQLADHSNAKEEKYCGLATVQMAQEQLSTINSQNEGKQQIQMNKIEENNQKRIISGDLSKGISEKECESESDSSAHTTRSEESFENENYDDLTQTPQNRMTRASQLGNGLTQNDNELIDLSLSSKVLLKLTQVKLLNGSTYVGQWLNGKREGQGTLEWSDGSIYSGEWLNNCSHGKGKLTYAYLGVYEGDFVQNKAEGKGVFTYRDGSQYEGQWKNNKRDGKGVLLWKDGERYEGNWVADCKQGFGELYFQPTKDTSSIVSIKEKALFAWQMVQAQLDNGRKDEKDIGGRVIQLQWYLGKRVRQPEEKKKFRDERTLSSQTQSF